MFKKVFRAALRKTKKWLEEPSTEIQLDKEKSLYRWLNQQSLIVLKHVHRRPHYVWGVVHAVGLAEVLGIRRVSVVELGVAGGNGLVALEETAAKVEELFPVKIDVHGFDTGVGLPKPSDYRDLPNLFSAGFYSMDSAKLKSRLKRAKLHLGQVQDTVQEFITSSPAPIAFVAIDLDLYTSTKCGLALFEADQNVLLPRVHCYVDDILGYTFSEFTGELLAISEFNACQSKRKISKINGLRYFVPREVAHQPWVDQFYMVHVFDHELYAHYDKSNAWTALDLSSDDTEG
jgi:hypothetical protein